MAPTDAGADSPGERPPHDTRRRARAVRAVRAALPHSAAIAAAADGEPADLRINGVPVRVTWLGDGELRQVRALLDSPRTPADIVVARQLSPGAREALSSAGVGWIDETGAADVSLPSLLVSRGGRRPRPAPEPRWTPSALAVTEALLCGTPATVSVVKQATGLSTGACAMALRLLSSLGLLTASAGRGRASGRRVADHSELLDRYAAAAAAVKPAATIRVGIAWRDPVAEVREAGQAWEREEMEWAATGTLAAAVLAPYLTSVGSGAVYVAAQTYLELEAVARSAGLRPMDGGRLTLRPFPTVASRRFATVRVGLRLVPWPRVYADLRTVGVRGEEAAEHLREVMDGSGGGSY